MDQFDHLRQEWAKAGQGHVFRFWDELNQQQRDALRKQVEVCLTN